MIPTGYCWEVSIEHVERVKWYAPHIRHVGSRCKMQTDPKIVNGLVFEIENWLMHTINVSIIKNINMP